MITCSGSSLHGGTALLAKLRHEGLVVGGSLTVSKQAEPSAACASIATGSFTDPSLLS